MLRSILITILALIGSVHLARAQPELDSLRQVAETEQGKAKVDALNRVCWKLRNYNATEALSYGMKAVAYAEEIGYEKGLAKAYSFSGVVFRNLGNYVDAFAYYNKGLQLARQIGLSEQEGYGHINLANLYIYQDDPGKSLQHLERASLIANEREDTSMQAYVSVNFGRAYTELQRFREAEYYLRQSYRLRGQLGDQDDQAVVLKYIGDAKLAQHKLDSALAYYQRAMSNPAAQTDLDLIADASNRSAKAYLRKDETEKAMPLAKQSLEISKQVGSKLRIRNAYETLAEVAERQQNYPDLADFRRQIILYNDSLFNSELTRQIANLEASAARQKQKAQLQVQELETKRQKTFRNALLIVLLLTAVLLGLALYANQKRQKANRALLEKNQQVEAQREKLQQYNQELSAQRDRLSTLNEQIAKKQRNIMDSINYAQRIQRAALPDAATLADCFSDYFVLNRPRDVVSGDFFWLGTSGDKTFIAVADCTGHGVPGAFMSMLGIAFLNQVMNDTIPSIRNGTVQTGVMLDQLRDKIKESLHQKDNQSISASIKDGMDMSLCMIDYREKTLQFAGALSTGLLVRQDGQLIALRGDRMPVGIYPKERPFQTQTYNLQTGDQLYLFSDGYVDQMGGEEGRKFLLARLKKCILAEAHQPMSEQEQALAQQLDQWQGDRNQTDDILLVGIHC